MTTPVQPGVWPPRASYRWVEVEPGIANIYRSDDVLTVQCLVDEVEPWIQRDQELVTSLTEGAAFVPPLSPPTPTEPEPVPPGTVLP